MLHYIKYFFSSLLFLSFLIPTVSFAQTLSTSYGYGTNYKNGAVIEYDANKTYSLSDLGIKGVGKYLIDVVPVVTPSLKIISGPSSNGTMNVELTLPRKYVGSYVVFMVNPVDVSSVSGGSIKGLKYSVNAISQSMRLNLNVGSAHEGVSTNDGGVHWFNLPTGEYRLSAVIYQANPFKSGTDMEYVDIDKLPVAFEIIDSKNYKFFSSKVTQNTPKVSPVGGYNTAEEYCITQGGNWVNGACDVSLKTITPNTGVISPIPNTAQAYCVKKGGIWNSGQCDDAQTYCMKQGGNWMNGACNTSVKVTPPPKVNPLNSVGGYNTAEEYCVAYGGRWTNGGCEKSLKTIPSSIIKTSPQVRGDFISNLSCADISENIHRGAGGGEVRTLQTFLQEKGFLDENPSGFYGDKTVEAVKDYQASKDLPETGMVYDFTRQAIRDDSCVD